MKIIILVFVITAVLAQKPQLIDGIIGSRPYNFNGSCIRIRYPLNYKRALFKWSIQSKVKAALVSDVPFDCTNTSIFDKCPANATVCSSTFYFFNDRLIIFTRIASGSRQLHLVFQCWRMPWLYIPIYLAFCSWSGYFIFRR